MLSRASLSGLEVVLFLPVKMVAANSAGERGGGGERRLRCGIQNKVCAKKSIQVVKRLKQWSHLNSTVTKRQPLNI